MKGYVRLILAAVLLVLLLCGCGGGGEEATVSVFPVSYQAYANSYSITGYQIGTNEDGNTVVTLYGSGYQKLSVDLFGGGGVRIPAWCEFEAAGEAHECLGAVAGKDSLEYRFDTSAIPETITFTYGETGEVLVSFVVEDEPQKS